MKTVCFTGHRPDKCGGYDEENEIAKYIKANLTLEITKAVDDGYRLFIQGGALGVDTWAGEIVADLADIYWLQQGIKIYQHLYSPFEGQENNWFDESKIRYYNLAIKCDKIVEVCEAGYAPWKMLKRDEAMVDAADLVIAVWNGDNKGGTAHTVKYAQKKNKPIIRINPKEAIA